MKLAKLNWPLVAYFGLGCVWLGSVAHSAFRVLSGDDMKVAGMALRLIVASFSGFLGVLLAMRCNWSAETTGILCGVAGWWVGDPSAPLSAV